MSSTERSCLKSRQNGQTQMCNALKYSKKFFLESFKFATIGGYDVHISLFPVIHVFSPAKSHALGVILTH